MSYDAADDTLSVGLNQPPADPSNPSSGPVIAGDADDNGNAGNVNPAVAGARPLLQRVPGAEGQDIQMAAFLDLDRCRHAGRRRRVLAEPSRRSRPTVASPAPIPRRLNRIRSQWRSPIINPQGNPDVSVRRSRQSRATSICSIPPAHPNLEFSITDFSQLYQAETGHALTPTSVIGIGAFAGSLHDGGISDAFFPENTFTLAQATVPPVNPAAFAAHPDQPP